VRLACDDRALLIEVADDGAARPAVRPGGRPAAQADGSGNGIAGMTERAVALGGTLQAGPRPGGGFQVRAALPLRGRPLPPGSRRGSER
jgi:signal transduction histidine kinase